MHAELLVVVPQHEAVNHGNAAVAEVLLQHGAMVNMPGLDNETPLHDAVANNRLDCVRLLMAYGASSTARRVWKMDGRGLSYENLVLLHPHPHLPQLIVNAG